MSLMTIRQKKIRTFICLTCFLTFYLGFNQQIMCFEFNAAGEIHKSHLQLIECNPLSAHSIRTSHGPGIPIQGMLAADVSVHGCTDCRDIHLSIKKNPGLDFSGMGPLVSFLPFAYPILSDTLITGTLFQNKKAPGAAHPTVVVYNSSLTALRTTVLLI